MEPSVPSRLLTAINCINRGIFQIPDDYPEKQEEYVVGYDGREYGKLVIGVDGSLELECSRSWIVSEEQFRLVLDLVEQILLANS